MKAPKSCILLVAALTVSGNVRAWAGSQSLLDPYASVQAPGSKPKVSKTKASKASANQSEGQSEEKAEVKRGSSTRSALSSSEGEEERPGEKAEKPVKSEKPLKNEKKTPIAKGKGEAKAASKPLATDSSDSGVVSGINDIKKSYVKTFKAAGSGIVNGTKAAGAKVADGGKKVKDGVASGVMKGARAIGHGFKLPGGKAKNGGSEVSNKVAAAPRKPSHSAKSEAIEGAGSEAKSASQEVTEKVLDDASFPGKPLEPLATKPLDKGSKSAPNMLGRTIGKFNVFGHAKKQPAAPAARAAATDLSQPFPN